MFLEQEKRKELKLMTRNWVETFSSDFYEKLFWMKGILYVSASSSKLKMSTTCFQHFVLFWKALEKRTTENPFEDVCLLEIFPKHFFASSQTLETFSQTSTAQTWMNEDFDVCLPLSTLQFYLNSHAKSAFNFLFNNFQLQNPEKSWTETYLPLASLLWIKN